MITSYRDTSGHPWALYYMRPAWNRRKAHQQRYVPAPGPGTCNACRKSIDRGRFYYVRMDRDGDPVDVQAGDGDSHTGLLCRPCGKAQGLRPVDSAQPPATARGTTP
jgi:hypothetical protein